jgi:hypothetical protein
MDILAITLIVSFFIGFFLVQQDELCFSLKSVLVLCSIAFTVSLIKLVEQFGLSWLFHFLLIAGTIYLIPEYIKSYNEGEARRKRIAEHKRKTTVHYFLSQDQGPGPE